MFGLKLINDKQLDALKETVNVAQRAIEDMGWINLSSDDGNINNLIAGGFKKMLQRVKLYYYNNPLAGHWVSLTTNFVFGEGVSVPKAKDESIQEVIDEFWNNPDNQLAFTSFQAQQKLSNKIQYEGNIFFLMFDDEAGNIRLRIMDTQEVDDIIKDTEDKMRTNFFKVKLKERKYNFTSDSFQSITSSQFIYYPDKDNWAFQKFGIPPAKLQNDAKVYHVKVNCDINDKFGVPELYRGIDWMKAQKDMMGDLATLVKALSKFAWKKKIKGSAAQTAAIANNMKSTLDLSNIRNSSGQTQVENAGVDLQSVDIKTGGVKIGVESGRQMKLMVSAASGLPEHYWGDPSTSNLATSKTLELPVVKKFSTYQKFWTDVINTILQYQIDSKIAVGVLPGTIVEDPKNNRVSYETDLDRTIDTDFPPIVEEDIKIAAEGYAKAKSEGLMSKDLAATQFMLAANINNIEEELETIHEEEEEREQKEKEKFDATNAANAALKGVVVSDPGKAAPAKKGKPDPLKEAINVPGKDGVRLARKSNFLKQKMNGYRKALAGSFRLLQKEIKEATEVAEAHGVATGIVRNPENIIRAFGERMKASARIYFPVAIEIGEKFMQAELKDIGVSEALLEANGKAPNVLRETLLWNDEYVTASLVPDIIDKINRKQVQAQESASAYRRGINEAVLTFEPRVEQYVGALWTVEETAVKEAGKGSGVMVNFAGEEDEANCKGCQAALDGNPWLIDSVPVPGTLECLGRCRHAIQVIKP